MSTKAMKLALDALEACINELVDEHNETDTDCTACRAVGQARKAIAALRQAIAQPAKEWTDENVIAWCVERGVQAAKEPQPAQVPAELSLNIIRKWPDGFQKRLDHVWKDVDGFIPNVKLYDLQRTLAEFGFTMKVYEQAAPEVK